MDEFFDQMKENLERRQEPSFNPAAWERMQRQMHAVEKRNRRGIGWWWITGVGLLLLAMGIGNVILASQLHDAKNEMLKLVAPEPSLVDTVYQERIVFVRDTVIIERIIEQPAMSWTAGRPTESRKELTEAEVLTISRNDQEQTIRPGESVTKEIKSELPEVTDVVQQTERTEATLLRKSWMFEHLPHLPWSYLALPVRPNPVTTGATLFSILPRKKQSLWEFLQPEAFEVGTYVEWNTTLLSDVTSKSGYGIGIESTIYFNRHWHIWAGYQYMQLRYRTLRMGEDLDIPVVESPLENFDFTQTDVTIPAWQVNVGVNYQFRFDQFRPYVGLGFATSRLLERALIYSFEDEDLDLDLAIRYEIAGSEFAGKQWIFRTGLDYMIGRHWSLNIEGNFRSALNADTPRTLNILGVRSGIYYIF